MLNTNYFYNPTYTLPQPTGSVNTPAFSHNALMGNSLSLDQQTPFSYKTGLFPNSNTFTTAATTPVAPSQDISTVLQTIMTIIVAIVQKARQEKAADVVAEDKPAKDVTAQKDVGGGGGCGGAGGAGNAGNAGNAADNGQKVKLPDTQKPAPVARTAEVNAAGDSEQQEFLNLVNKARAENGLKPVKLNAKLNAAATKHSQTMARLNNMDHEAGGTKFGDRIKAEGYGNPRAENIAMGANNAKSVFEMWMNSPGHRSNILMADATEIGLGRDGNYWTQTVGNA